MKTQFDVHERPLPATHDPIEFSKAAETALDRLNGVEAENLLSEADGGVIYSASGASEQDRQTAAATFALARLNTESVDVSNTSTWDYMYIKNDLKPIFSDPALEREIKSKDDQVQEINRDISQLEIQAGANPTSQQKSELDALTQRRNSIFQEIESLKNTQSRLVDERINATAAQDGNSELSAVELTNYILTIDQDKDGVIENSEDRFTPHRNQSNPTSSTFS